MAGRLRLFVSAAPDLEAEREVICQEGLDHEARSEQEAKEAGREAGGAGEGGVIITPGRDVPPGGVFIEPKAEEDN